MFLPRVSSWRASRFTNHANRKARTRRYTVRAGHTTSVRGYSARYYLDVLACAAIGFALEYNFDIVERVLELANGPPANSFEREMSDLLGDRYDSTMACRESVLPIGKFDATPVEAVLFPESAEEVEEIVRICNAHKKPIIPCGSCTSICGQLASNGQAVAVSMKRMSKILRFSEDDMDVTVQPGVSYEDLNEFLEPFGLFFPLDPGPGASIGGMVSTSCSGPNAVRYGTMKENVLSLKVVTAEGHKISTGNRSRKKSAGYNLTALYVGAEGTLGVVTEITLRLHPIPKARSLVVSTYDTVDQIAKVVSTCLKSGIRVGRAEIIDAVQVKAINIYNGSDMPEKNTLVVELSGAPEQVLSDAKAVVDIASNVNANTIQQVDDKETMEDLWTLRKSAYWAAFSLVEGSKSIVTDVCVPMTSLGTILSSVDEDIKRTGLLAPLVGHVGDGNFHLGILHSDKDLHVAKEIEHNMMKKVLELGGTCSGEHGIGIEKKEWLEEELGVESVNVMRKIKKAIDPNGIFNPGKVFD